MSDSFESASVVQQDVLCLQHQRLYSAVKPGVAKLRVLIGGVEFTGKVVDELKDAFGQPAMDKLEPISFRELLQLAQERGGLYPAGSFIQELNGLLRGDRFVLAGPGSLMGVFPEEEKCVGTLVLGFKE